MTAGGGSETYAAFSTVALVGAVLGPVALIAVAVGACSVHAQELLHVNARQLQKLQMIFCARDFNCMCSTPF